MSEKNEKRLKAVKTIYGKEAFEKGLKIKSHLQISINNPQFKLNQIQKKPFEIV